MSRRFGGVALSAESEADDRTVAMPATPHKRGVVTDEISQDLDIAIRMAVEFNLDGLDIRSVWGKTIHQLDDDELTRLRRAADDAHLAIACVAPPFMKCTISDVAEWMEHKKILEQSIRAADRLDARFVRGFTFWKEIGLERHWGRIVDAYREVAPMIERSGLIVAIENEPSCMIGTTEHLPRLLRDIGSSSIRALWDPANAAHDGEIATPDGFDRIIGDSVHIHIKDGRHVDGKWEHAIVGEGAVGLVDVSRALAQHGYDGWVTLETHYRPKPTGSDLRRPAGHAFSELGEEGTRDCLIGWRKVLSESRR